MKKSISILVAMLLVVFSATAQAKKTVKKKKFVNKTSITSVEIHRGNCYGRCPDYRLTLNATGAATYVGRKFATYKGTYKKTFSSAQVQTLFQEFERYRVDTCSEEYPYMPDISELTITIVYKDGREQEIKRANGPLSPRFLKGLAAKMDKMAPVNKTWRKTENWKEEDPAIGR